jgi:hypothetical protein
MPVAQGARTAGPAGALLQQPLQGGSVDVVGDQIAEDVQALLADGRERPLASHPVKAPLGRDPAQERPPEPVALEDPMPGQADHGAVPAARVAGVAVQHRLATQGPDAAVVDLVPGGGHTAEPGRGPDRVGEHLGRLKDRLHRQQAKTGDLAGVALDPVGDALPEELVAATDAQDGQATGGPLDQYLVQPHPPKPGQVGDGGLRARHHGQVGRPHLGRGGGEPHPYARLGSQRVNVGEVRQPGQAHHRHPQRVGPTGRGRPVGGGFEFDRVLGVQPQPEPPGQHAQHRAAGEPAELIQSRGQDRRVAAELVDQEPGHQRLVGLIEQGQGPEQAGEHPTAVDVAHDHHRQPSRSGQAQVDQVVGAQVDLGRAAGPLADDHLEAAGQTGQGLQDDCPEAWLQALVGAGVQLGQGLAHDDHLAGPLAARFEQDRVHGRLRRQASRGRLGHLGPTDLGPLRGDGRV